MYSEDMLTKEDLDQIRSIVAEETEKQVETQLYDLKQAIYGEIKLARMAVQNEIRSVEKKVDKLEKRLISFEERTAESFKVMSNYFEDEELKLEKRITSVEKHIGLS
jgi:flagellar capping protein FliD